MAALAALYIFGSGLVLVFHASSRVFIVAVVVVDACLTAWVISFIAKRQTLVAYLLGVVGPFVFVAADEEIGLSPRLILIALPLAAGGAAAAFFQRRYQVPPQTPTPPDAQTAR